MQFEWHFERVQRFHSTLLRHLQSLEESQYKRELQRAGFMVVPESDVDEFKRLLIAYYEGASEKELVEFFKSKALKALPAT